MNLGTATVIHGNALDLPLEDDSVDLVVTSPPYFGLRSYTDNGEHYTGQLGSEATPAEFVDALIMATREMMRVVKPSGSIFVNLGDKYSTYESRPGRAATHEWAEKSQQAQRYTRNAPDAYGIPYKSLMGIPWRYALACIDQLGLILRAEIIWNKPNGLPESVTDRVRRSHEQWFHYTLSPRYYSAVDEIRETHLHGGHGTDWAGRKALGNPTYSPDNGHVGAIGSDNRMTGNPLGKLPGSVWVIPTQPLTVPPHLGVDHFAAYPTEWPKRIIQGWSPAAICVGCGEGRRPTTGFDGPHDLAPVRVLSDAETALCGQLFSEWQDSAGIPSQQIASLFPSRTGGLTGCVANWRMGANVLTPEQTQLITARFGTLPERLTALIHKTELRPVRGGNFQESKRDRKGDDTGAKAFLHKQPPTRSVIGYACACPDTSAPTTPSTILDPFGGTGTTALVAKALGRHGITIDLSLDYCRLAEWRTSDRNQLAHVLDMEKAPAADPDQLDLFADGVAG